jgi:hypothetical protein
VGLYYCSCLQVYHVVYAWSIFSIEYTMAGHVHQLVPIKIPQDDYTVYWCRDCGLICERINGKIYEMVPAWSKKRLLNEDRKTEQYRFLPIKQEKPHKTTRSLGKGLKDIKVVENQGLARLFGLKNGLDEKKTPKS